jgi:hypothetical protein
VKIKNAIVMATSSGCECDTWMLVMSSLKEKVGIHPRYFIYYDEEKLKQGKSDFLSKVGNDVFFHSELDNYKGKGYCKYKKNNVLDNDLLDFISSYELIALKMMDRFDPLSNAFTFTNRQYYFRELVLRWLDIIDELDLEIFISPDVPHRVSDYALYVACIVKKIEFIFFDLTPFGDASLINDSIEEYQSDAFTLESSCKTNKNNDLIVSKLNDFRGIKDNYKLWYMEEQSKKASISTHSKFSRRIGGFIRRGRILQPVSVFNTFFVKEIWSYYVKPHSMPYNSEFKVMEKRTIDLKTSKDSKSYLSIYNKLVTDIDIIKTKYVVFALHYQPEATTSPNGGVFVDQLLVIEMLDRLLPLDVVILVKEHKSQFFGVLESASAGRSKVFYDRLSQFSERVKIVSLDLNSFDLIDNAEAVVTVTGTIGIESLARGKPVFCFGRTWYQNFKGAFPIRNKNDLVAAWSKINESDFAISEEDVDKYVDKVSNYFVWGLHSGAYRKVSNRSQEETVANIVNGVISFLKNKEII